VTSSSRSNAGPEQSDEAVVAVSHGLFQLIDRGVVPELGPDIAGLVVPLVSGGIAVVCGISAGPVRVRAETWAAAPPPDPAAWDETGEVGFYAPVGSVRVTPLFEDPVPGIPALTAGPGAHRARVYARGRDTARNRVVGASTEEYLVQVWPADRGRRRPIG
jgi:hypothetical protein